MEMSGANVPSSAPVSEDAVAGADAIKDAVSEQSVTIAGLVERLDSWGFTVADTRVSVWSLLVVIMVVAAVIIGARLLSKLSHSVLDRTTKLDPSQRLLGEKILTNSGLVDGDPHWHRHAGDQSHRAHGVLRCLRPCHRFRPAEDLRQP